MKHNSEQMSTLRWLPTLYFAKGLLYVIVFFVSLLMLRQTGLDNAETTACVALCYLPWVLKYKWKPLVDWQRNSQRVILLTELLLVMAFTVLAFVLSSLWMTLVLLLLIACLTSVHNVAVDTFYKVAVGKEDSATYRTVRELSRKLADVVGLGVLVMLVGNLQVVYRNAQVFSWRYTTYCVALIFLLLFFWHLMCLSRLRPRGLQLHQDEAVLESVTGHRLPAASVMFLLTFLFAAIMQGKMAVLFLVENRSSGGLGFSPQEFGFVMGTVGVLGVTIGVVAGNKLVRRLGVGPLLVPMGVVLALPSIVYTLLSYWQPSEMWLVSLSVLIEQLAYGLGLSAYLAYQTSLPNKKLAKSLMAVSMMAACALSGLLQVQMGYNSFFITTLSLSVVTLISVCLVRKYSGSESFV